MSKPRTVRRACVGDIIGAFLERCGVGVCFGVISIHNLPILDALGRRGAIRFVPARGEAGAANMADAFARASGGLGVVITSTGTAAGNAAGGLIEAQCAGTPLLHITGQIESAYLDQGRAYIHEARDQLGMLRAISKAAFRIDAASTALDTLKRAVGVALSAPCGPVSVEIPIDIQEAEIPWPDDMEPVEVSVPVPSPHALDRLAERLVSARRPLLWLGGGAREAGAAVGDLAKLGFGVVTSVQGRGVLTEDHPASLGAFNMSPPVEDFYGTCDALLVVGSRLRGNETLTYALKLPRPLYRIDADPNADGRSYANELFVLGDASLALQGLAERLRGRMSVAPAFIGDLQAARGAAERNLRQGLGPYGALVDALQRAAGREFLWVRDVTISNSTWGNRLLKIFGPRDGVHALGGGIGQCLAMGIGAALASGGRKTICLLGDGGLQLGLAELATAVQEKADLLLIVMNSNGYGVIKNIQDAKFGGRHYYVDLLTPDFGQAAAAVGMVHQRLDSLDGVARAIAAALQRRGPMVLEIDMAAVGDFARAFAGPPQRAAAPVQA